MTPFAKLGEMNKEATSAASDETAIRRLRDEKALRNRHIALALKRALQGAAVGTIVGGIGSGDQNGALLGLLGGGLTGAGIGTAEGGIKRSLGLDPMLETTLMAQRA